MDGAAWIAKQLKGRDNADNIAYMTGNIISIEPLQIRINDDVILSDKHIRATFDIKEKIVVDEIQKYKNINKTAVLLPDKEYSNYIVVGVVFDG